MLVFAIALKSAKVARDWEQTCKIFERSIRSVCAQTASEFKAIVVCHEQPKIQFHHPNIEYLQVRFPIPGDDIEKKRLDRRRKVFAGLLTAKKYHPTHTMIMDADDCVSKHLAEWVKQNRDGNGWVFNKGYLYEEGSNFLFREKKAFYQWCGSSHIIRYDLQDLPENTDDDRIDYNRYHRPHAYIVDIMQKKGTPLEPLPFFGAIYMLAHGENVRDFANVIRPKKLLPRLKKVVVNYRPLTPVIRDEFCLYSLEDNCSFH